jgi:hypothetical protein
MSKLSLNLLLAALLFDALPAHAASPQPAPPAHCAQDDRKAEFEKRLAEAKGDREALWKVYDWAEAFGMSKESRQVLRAILEVDDGDAKAHELLGHVLYDGKWFPNEKKKLEYQQQKEEAEAKAKGYVRYKDTWVDPKDVPYLEKGWVKLESGEWVDPEEHKRVTEGWVKQDLTWVAPEDKPKLEQGLWKCGDQWLSLEEADQYHSKFGQWWQIPGRHFVLWTTLDRATAIKALEEIDGGLSDLNAFFGVSPKSPPHLLLLNSLDQYNAMAKGSETVAYEAFGFSGGTYGFFADLWFDPASSKYLGCGVGYWDASSEAGNRFGRHAARLAAGLSYVEGLDPSPKAIAKLTSSTSGKKNARFDPSKFPLQEFYGEKRLPFSLRYGAACFFERYFLDRTAPSGGDVHWPRHWAMQNIERRGGLDPLAKILAFQPDQSMQADPDKAGKMASQCGLLISFVMHGNCQPVQEAHRAWREAFQSGGDIQKATVALFKAIEAHEAEFRKYASS